MMRTRTNRTTAQERVEALLTLLYHMRCRCSVVFREYLYVCLYQLTHTAVSTVAVQHLCRPLFYSSSAAAAANSSPCCCSSTPLLLDSSATLPLYSGLLSCSSTPPAEQQYSTRTAVRGMLVFMNRYDCPSGAACSSLRLLGCVRSQKHKTEKRMSLSLRHTLNPPRLRCPLDRQIGTESG